VSLNEKVKVIEAIEKDNVGVVHECKIKKIYIPGPVV
jgi:hypothetical protein